MWPEETVPVLENPEFKTNLLQGETEEDGQGTSRYGKYLPEDDVVVHLDKLRLNHEAKQKKKNV
jgi:hypothetical protein